MPAQGEPNEAHALALWVLYNRHFVKKEIRGPIWRKVFGDEVVVPSKKHTDQNYVGVPTIKIPEQGCSCKYQAACSE